MRSVPLDRSRIKIHLTQARRKIGKNEDRERRFITGISTPRKGKKEIYMEINSKKQKNI